ncbi:phosphatase PAP2 family protein [Microbacterium mangrovi]|uniref:phosphatase PAP2 family protein n=1 Tax=Microbacterium mangrovi TaxID=1348253 RepID=UPI0006919E2E|nr:phosphatase PAP2 family protein [Microbacterium mangrovi]
MSQPTDAARRFPTGVFVACLLIAAAVAGFGLFIVGHPSWSAIEVDVVRAVNAAHFPAMDAVALTINWLFGPGGVFVGVALVVAVFTLTRSAWSATRAALLLMLPWAVAALMKRFVGRMRPDPSLMTHLLIPSPRSLSYPSGHTAFAAALVCAVVLSIAVRRARRTTAVIGAVLVLLVGYSRVYLGVHYPSDTIASMIAVPALSLACALLLAASGVFRRAPFIGSRAAAVPLR